VSREAKRVRIGATEYNQLNKPLRTKIVVLGPMLSSASVDVPDSALPVSDSNENTSGG
jgi:hypothetical protein